MTITLITGANRSLGHETARRLIEAGHTVVLGARDPELGRAAADGLGARFVQLDVTDDPDRVESTFPAPLYTASKSAVTMLTTQYAKGLAGHQGQRGRSRLHRDRLQRAQRPPDDQRRHRRHRRVGHDRC